MGSSNGEIKDRLVTVLGGLLLTCVVGLFYLDARFGSGLAPAPFLAFVYVCGLAAGFLAGLVLPSSMAYRLVLLVATVATIGVAASGDSQIYFWFGAIPSVGALAATFPLSGDGES